MTQIKSNIPKIRFKEFSWEWESWKIEKNFQVRMCKRIFSSDTTPNWEIPFYKIWTIWKKADSFISRELFEEYKTKYNYPKKWELMITCSWTVWRTIIFNWKDSYFQDSNIVWLDNQHWELNNDFLYYIISNFDWWKLNATTITRIYNDDLRKLKINFPQLPEQQKISSFLSSVDEKIEKIKEKKKNLEEYKKWIMQKIFKQEIRFKDENWEEFGEWEEKKIWDIFEVTRWYVLAMTELKENTDEFNKYPVYSSQTKRNWLAWYYKKFLYENAITWTTDWANAWDVKLRKWKFYCTNVCWVLLSNDWYVNLCISELLNTVTHKYVSYVWNPKLMNNVMSNIKLKIPSSIEEQQKIADFLSGIDEKIEKVNEELGQIEEFKKGLLQGMFV